MGHRSTSGADGRGAATGRRAAGGRHHGHPIVVLATLVVLAVVPAGALIGFGAGTTARRAPSPRPATPSTEVVRHATVLLIGDSLIHEAAEGVRAALPDATVVDGSVPGTGLLNGPTDWAVRADELVARYQPDVVVVSFVGNYDRATGTLVPDTPEFAAAWGAAATRLTDDLRAHAVRVDWVGQPPVATPNFYGLGAERVAMVRDLAQRLASTPGVAYVDGDDAVDGPEGTYTASHDVCGTTVTIRLGDGVHFTTVGAAWWGAHLGLAVARAERLPALDPCTVLASLDPTLG